MMADTDNMGKTENLFDLIKRHEGLRLKPYRCPAGKLTIGYGRNLDDVGISKDEAEMMLMHDITRCLADIRRNIPVYQDLDEVRQAILVDMCYNMGISRLLEFKHMLAALSNHDYPRAAVAMLASKWAQQVPVRAKELAEMMISGKIQT